jgi:hypothetical protein
MVYLERTFMETIENSAKRLMQFVLASDAGKIIIWLNSYMLGYDHDPHFEKPHDEDGHVVSQYLSSMLWFLQKNVGGENANSTVSHISNAAITLLEQLVRDPDGKKIDGNYIVDLCTIVEAFTTPFPIAAVEALCLMKDDPKFRIDYSHGPIRGHIFLALDKQVSVVSKPSDLVWVLPRLEPDLQDQHYCASAIYVLFRIDPDAAIERFRQVVQLRLANGGKTSSMLDGIAQIMRKDNARWKKLLQEALKLPDRAIHDQLEACRLDLEKWEVEHPDAVV